MVINKINRWFKLPEINLDSIDEYYDQLYGTNKNDDALNSEIDKKNNDFDSNNTNDNSNVSNGDINNNTIKNSMIINNLIIITRIKVKPMMI